MPKGMSRTPIWLTFLCILVCTIGCAPIVYSPHAQNEMLTPYNRSGESHELGAASALNLWFVEQHKDTLYMKTYPEASFGLFHNAYYATGRWGGIGGIEIIGFPSTFLVSGAPGFVFGVRPYTGVQYASPGFTARLNFAPFLLVAGIADGEWETGADLDRATFYQLTLMFHNRPPSKGMYWGGSRLSPAALGLVGGYEHAYTEKFILRTELSVLAKPPFSPFLDRDVLESIQGIVFYVTCGAFWRLK